MLRHLIHVRVKTVPVLVTIVCAMLLTMGPITSCTYDKASPLGLCDTFIPSYADTVAEIIVKYCSDANLGDCHDGTGTEDQPDYSTFVGIQGQALSGAITEQVFEKGEMPNSDTQGDSILTSGDADLLRCWIANGAPDN